MLLPCCAACPGEQLSSPRSNASWALSQSKLPEQRLRGCAQRIGPHSLSDTSAGPQFVGALPGEGVAAGSHSARSGAERGRARAQLQPAVSQLWAAAPWGRGGQPPSAAPALHARALSHGQAGPGPSSAAQHSPPRLARASTPPPAAPGPAGDRPEAGHSQWEQPAWPRDAGRQPWPAAEPAGAGAPPAKRARLWCGAGAPGGPPSRGDQAAGAAPRPAAGRAGDERLGAAAGGAQAAAVHHTGGAQGARGRRAGGHAAAHQGPPVCAAGHSRAVGIHPGPGGRGTRIACVPRSAKRCSASRKRHLQSRVALGFVCGPACNSSSEAQARLKPYSTRNVPSELRALRLSRKLFLSLVRLVVTNYESAILTALSTSIRMLLPERRHYSQRTTLAPRLLKSSTALAQTAQCPWAPSRSCAVRRMRLQTCFRPSLLHYASLSTRN